MHNGYGSGDVAINIRVASRTTSPNERRTEVILAGHKALYRRIGGRAEEWLVRIQKTTLAIRLDAKPGTSDADLAEAHAIVKSMRTEARHTKLGFRLVFTLKTNEWDSG